MTKQNIGFLHPGAMGISLAASAQNSGHMAYWVSEGRSQDTHARAAQYDLVDARTLPALCETCSVIVSICPPHAAVDVAHQVITCSFKGLYLDANAISPERAGRIAAAVTTAGATYVDGGIIGGPAWEPARTWLYLSGPEAGRVAACFSAGPLETAVIGEAIGKASALKMCFAAYTKGTTALLCAILATAEGLGVRADLERQWSRGGSDFASQAQNRVRRVTAKAWRFAGEMEEISKTFSGVGIPGDFHRGAREIYHRLAIYKDAPEPPKLEAVLETLLQNQEKGTS